MTREEALQAIKEKMDYYERDKRLRAAIETLIPELCENEDEKTRKEIIDFIQWAEDRGMTRHDYHQAKRPAVWIAYLENQKEQIPYTDFVIKPHKGDENNPYDMSASEAQKYAIKRGFGVPFIDGEVYVDERHIIQTVGNIIRWADEHPKEQKPVERSLEDDHIIGFVYDLLNEIEWKDNWAMSKEECLRMLNNYRPQNSAGWSEEDEDYLTDVKCAVYDYFDEGYAEELWGRLKSLRPKPKQEWSEEDEKKIVKLKTFITQEWFNKENQKKAIDMIDALRPQPHIVLDEWDIWAIEQAIKDNDDPECKNHQNALKKLYGKIKSASLLHWKPSEEQIKALSDIVEQFKPDKELESLYNDLKKLM